MRSGESIRPQTYLHSSAVASWRDRSDRPSALAALTLAEREDIAEESLPAYRFVQLPPGFPELPQR